MRLLAIVPIAATAALFVAGIGRDTQACGGCFHEPPPPSQPQSGTVVTDHRMIFSISPQETSLYDEVKYAGSPSSFAWVLPIRGPVTVGLSSDVVFTALEQATQTGVVGPNLPPCAVCGPCGGYAGGGFGGGGGSAGSSSGGASAPAPPPVTVISQQTVGPYETVELRSADPTALDAWLTVNGYVIPSDVQPIIAAYVYEGFDFLAMKLAPGQGIQAMRPVRVTSPGAGLSLPLRMVAAGTGATVGITLWVIADGRYEPKNFLFFTISPSELNWSQQASISNYATIRAQKESSFKNWAWQIESSLDILPFQVENSVISTGTDYLPVLASDAGDGGGGKSAGQVMKDDLSALFPGGGTSVRVTRMRADLSRAALTNDLVLQASIDQSVLSNVYQITNFTPCPACVCSGLSGGSDGVSSSGGSGMPPGGAGHCAASTIAPGRGAVGFVAAGFIGIALLRVRRRRS
jgi:hypothetical protein